MNGKAAAADQRRAAWRAMRGKSAGLMWISFRSAAVSALRTTREARYCQCSQGRGRENISVKKPMARLRRSTSLVDN